MKTITRDDWIAALRSGQFTQGKKSLRTADGKNCCLGVLCEIIDPARFRPDFGRYRYVSQGDMGEILNQVPHLRGVEWELIDMNDIEEKSFSEIADWIEAKIAPFTIEVPE